MEANQSLTLHIKTTTTKIVGAVVVAASGYAFVEGTENIERKKVYNRAYNSAHTHKG